MTSTVLLSFHDRRSWLDRIGARRSTRRSSSGSFIHGISRLPSNSVSSDSLAKQSRQCISVAHEKGTFPMRPCCFLIVSPCLRLRSHDSTCSADGRCAHSLNVWLRKGRGGWVSVATDSQHKWTICRMFNDSSGCRKGLWDCCSPRRKLHACIAHSLDCSQSRMLGVAKGPAVRLAWSIYAVWCAEQQTSYAPFAEGYIKR